MAPLAAPEPMNATASHSKIKVSMTLPKESVVAGRHVTGKMDVECKSDKLAIGIMMVELFAFQELTSRDHSARMTFLHTRRLFQGPNLPPSNAVHAHPLPGDAPLPEGYYKAKRGQSTFLFRIPLPSSSPASVDFASGLAKVRYEVRGSVGVFWKGERQLVTDKSQVGVLESSDSAIGGLLGGAVASRAEEGAVVVGENGRFWMHGRVVGGIGGVLVAGESACVELQVKNHSSRKNSALTLLLRRTLVLPSNPKAATEPLEISDTLLNVPYKGPEYTLSPGGEGVAHLVFDVPLDARSVRGGLYDDEDERTSEALFCVQASIEVRVTMGSFSSKDIVLDIPVTIVHPDALPEIEAPVIYPQYATAAVPAPVPAHMPYQTPYIDPHTQQVWISPPRALPLPYQQYHSPPDQAQVYYPPHPHQQAAYNHLLNLPQPPQLPHNVPQRPSSAGPVLVDTTGSGAAGIERVPPISGLPGPGPGVLMPYASLLPLPSPSYPHHNHNQQQQQSIPQHLRPPLPPPPHQQHLTPGGGDVSGEREEGKGVVASRISSHLRESSVLVGRGRSVSPVGHRFGYPSNVGGETVATGGSGSGSGDGAATTVLHSPRPRITHKQSFTKDVVDGKAMTRSEKVVELEEIAAGLEHGQQQGKGKGKERHEAHSPTAHQLSLSSQDVNKTLPVPPPLTKPRQFLKSTMLAGNGVPLDSLFVPPTNSAGSAPVSLTTNATTPTATTGTATFTATKPAITTHLVSSPLPSPSDGSGNYPTPPTPTLVAFKRPPKLTAPGGACGNESGLDALERRLTAQVGTRKVEKGAKFPHIRDALVASPLAMAMPTPPAMRTPNSEVPTTPGTGIGTSAGVGSGRGGGTGSVSASASSEKQDESAISSLTLDERSVEGADADDGSAVEQEKEREDDEQLEQESMDGGKTHRAGKSVVGIESYFHSHATAAVQVVYPQSQVTATNNSNSLNLNTSNTTALNSSAIPKKRSPPVKKSVQARGRVAAWLGNIDPGVPPQEEIIPPSPSVVRHPDLDILSGEEKGDEAENGIERRHRREGGRYRSRSSSRSPLPIFVPAPAPVSQTPPPDINAPLLSKDKQDFSPSPAAATPASPDPRSSGFMPMETMKAQRDTITKSMTRSMIRRAGGDMDTGREMTVVQEARKVMEIWSEGLPTSEGHNEGKEKKAPQYPFLAAIPPKAQTIRTDRRVSPPSASAAPSSPAPIPEPREFGPVLEIVPAPILVPPTETVAKGREELKSYASVANAGLAAKQKPQPPNLPPPRVDPEVKYDIRSARGGRGGKVTQVASLWAAVATGNGPRNAANPPEGPARGKKEVKDSLLDKVNGASNTVEARYAPKSGSMVFPSTKPTTSSPLSNAAATIANTPRAKTPQAKTPTLPSNPKYSAPIPNLPITVTPASAANKTLPKRPELPSFPKPAKKSSTKAPIISASMAKSLSVPATVSSSLATPTLMSTASLARPVGSSSSQTSTIPVGLPGLGKGDYKGSLSGSAPKEPPGIVKSGLGVVDEEDGAGNGGKLFVKRTGGTPAAPASAIRSGGVNGVGGTTKSYAATAGGGSDAIKRPPSRDLAFGQARLRDLIKKYQGGNT